MREDKGTMQNTLHGCQAHAKKLAQDFLTQVERLKLGRGCRPGALCMPKGWEAFWRARKGRRGRTMGKQDRRTAGAEPAMPERSAEDELSGRSVKLGCGGAVLGCLDAGTFLIRPTELACPPWRDSQRRVLCPLAVVGSRRAHRSPRRPRRPNNQRLSFIFFLVSLPLSIRHALTSHSCRLAPGHRPSPPPATPSSLLSLVPQVQRLLAPDSTKLWLPRHLSHLLSSFPAKHGQLEQLQRRRARMGVETRPGFASFTGRPSPSFFPPSLFFIALHSRLLTRFQRTSSLLSMDPYLLLISWTRSLVEFPRPKAPLTGLTLFARLASNSSSLPVLKQRKKPWLSSAAIRSLKNPKSK